MQQYVIKTILAMKMRRTTIRIAIAAPLRLLGEEYVSVLVLPSPGFAMVAVSRVRRLFMVVMWSLCDC